MTETNELEYVGFWMRVWASLIDLVLMLAVLFPIFFAVYGREKMAAGVMLTGAANIVVSYLLPAVVVLAFWMLKQGTPGKMVIGAVVLSAKTGAAPSLMQYVIRYVGYFVSAIPFCLGFLWVAIDSKKQGWHDKLAGTVVVRPRKRSAQPVTFTG